MNVLKTQTVTACSPSLLQEKNKFMQFPVNIFTITLYRHPIDSMEFLINADIKAIPAPLPDTIKISTNSRLRLKYCATINVEQSRVIPTVDEKENELIVFTNGHFISYQRQSRRLFRS